MPRKPEFYAQVWKNLTGEDTQLTSRRQLAGLLAARLSRLSIPGSPKPLFEPAELRRLVLQTRSLSQLADSLLMKTLDTIQETRPDISLEDLYDHLVQAQAFSSYYTEIVQALLGWLHIPDTSLAQALLRRRSLDTDALETYDQKTSLEAIAIDEMSKQHGHPGPFRVFRRRASTVR